MSGTPLCQPAMRQERVHPLVCLLPPFSTEEWQKPVDPNTLKGKHDKKSAHRQTRGCSNLSREKQASVLERLESDGVPREKAESREVELG